MNRSNEALIRMIRQGREELKADLLENNKGLIYKIMGEFSYLLTNPDNKDDLFQAGCLGMLKALKRYDFSFGVRFSTFAYRYIHGEVLRFADSIMNADRTYTDLFGNSDSDLLAEDVADYVQRAIHGDEACRSVENTVSNREMVRRILEEVTPKQREILICRYGKNMTQQEIGDRLGIHQVEVSREEKRARKNLRLLFGETGWGYY